MKGNSGSKWHSSINRCKSENVSPITGFFSILFFLDVSTWASWTCSFIDLITNSNEMGGGCCASLKRENSKV